MKQLIGSIKRVYNRWRLHRVIGTYNWKICVYHASTNSYTVQSVMTGCKYHVFIDTDGKLTFEPIIYE